jgi:hypothetical protein
MSSDLLGRFARVSEAWWQVAGFKPGHPPMLPLRARQDLRAAAAVPPLQPGPTSMQAPVLDTQAMLLALTSAITAEMQKVEHNLDGMVRRAVAEAMIQGQYPQMGRPPLAPPPSDVRVPSPPPEMFQPMDIIRVQPMDIETDIYGLTRDHPDADQSQFEDPPLLRHKDVTREILDALLPLHFPHVPNPTFKSPYQEQAVRLAVERQESFVAVLPTGGGKSLTYTLPAFNPKERGYRSYIIIPNRALLKDQIERAHALGLCAQWWTAGNPRVDDETQLVFLAMESAVSPSFKK